LAFQHLAMRNHSCQRTPWGTEKKVFIVESVAATATKKLKMTRRSAEMRRSQFAKWSWLIWRRLSS
ncbi:Hypothetical predicted protein, partial [Podarcis lilfordi]